MTEQPLWPEQPVQDDPGRAAAPSPDPADRPHSDQPAVDNRTLADDLPFDLQRRHCRQPGCRCTHDQGCEFGWIDTGRTTRPCPTCYPFKQPLPGETPDAWQARLRHQRKAKR